MAVNSLTRPVALISHSYPRKSRGSIIYREVIKILLALQTPYRNCFESVTTTLLHEKRKPEENLQPCRIITLFPPSRNYH